MADSAIEWCDRVWNPTTGCDRISPGCDNCYALTMAARLKGMGQPKYQNDGDPRTSGPGFALTVHPQTVNDPLTWRRPSKVFVNSMSDLFHADVPDEYLAEVFAVMALADQHTFQVLTKRPQRMAKLLANDAFMDEVDSARLRRDPYRLMPDWPRPNIWLGTSIESDRYTFRAEHLRATPAAVRWLSLEPLLGPLPSLDLTGIDWVVVGGESGPGARPMHPDWARDIRDRCIASGVPFFFKQWGEWVPAPWKVTRENEHLGATHGVRSDTGYVHELGHAPWSLERNDEAPDPWAGIRRVGKKAAGRELDGSTWDEYPAVAS